MALWGNNDNVGAAGSVSVNYATKTVTGGALTGQTGSLFGETGDDLPEPRIKDFQDWLPAERLAEEYIAIGFYLSLIHI